MLYLYDLIDKLMKVRIPFHQHVEGTVCIWRYIKLVMVRHSMTKQFKTNKCKGSIFDECEIIHDVSKAGCSNITSLQAVSSDRASPAVYFDMQFKWQRELLNEKFNRKKAV